MSYAGIKYNVKFKLINAADYGIPQTRERVVIVGIRADLDKIWSFPETTHSEDRLLWEMHVTGEYWKRHHVPAAKRPKIETTLTEKLNRLKDRYSLFEPENMPWATVRDALHDVPDPCKSMELKTIYLKLVQGVTQATPAVIMTGHQNN